MDTQTIQLFTEKEEAFVNLLLGTGMKRYPARVLVYLANIREATSRDIERGADLRQPEVCIGIKFLEGRGWISHRQIPSQKKGRPLTTFSLAVPVGDIVGVIEKETKAEADRQMETMEKVRGMV